LGVSWVDGSDAGLGGSTNVVTLGTYWLCIWHLVFVNELLIGFLQTTPNC